MTTEPAHDAADRLQEIRARCEAATVGPWGTFYDDISDRSSPEQDPAIGWEITGPPHPWRIGHYRLTADANFIANARADVPWLLEREQALRTALEHAVAWMVAYDYDKRVDPVPWVAEARALLGNAQEASPNSLVDFFAFVRSLPEHPDAESEWLSTGWDLAQRLVNGPAPIA